LIWYEQEEANLLDRYRAGKLDCRQFFTALMGALSRASWAMNKTEREELQRDLEWTLLSGLDQHRFHVSIQPLGR
jgi:hypothetical protein